MLLHTLSVRKRPIRHIRVFSTVAYLSVDMALHLVLMLGQLPGSS